MTATTLCRMKNSLLLLRVLPLTGAVVLSAVAVMPAFAAPAEAGKDYRAERFDVQFDLQPDGSALVTETVAFRFDGGPFTYVFRDINATETDGLTFIDASMDGQTMPLGTSAGQVEVTGRDPLKVKWHFAPTSDSTHEFVVRYRMAGVVRKLDADTIRWRAIPQEHGNRRGNDPQKQDSAEDAKGDRPSAGNPTHRVRAFGEGYWRSSGGGRLPRRRRGRLLGQRRPLERAE